MKAVVIREFGAFDRAKVEDVDDPAPKPHEVLLDIALAPVNYVDTLVFSGKYQFLPETPFIPGKGPVGTVRAVGAAVTGFKPGDRVLAMAESGGYAQAIAVAEDQCYQLPDELSFEDAASISLAYDTAWFALVERARLKAGETVLVLGALGSVGVAAVQLAKAKGATVIAAISGTERMAAAKGLGADHVVDLSVPDLRDNLREQIKAVTAGKGVDVVIDPLGGEPFEAAIRAVAWRGRLVVVGFAAGHIPSLKVNYLMLKNIEVSGLQVSDYRKRLPSMMRECFEDIFALHVQGRLKGRPVTYFALDKFNDALSGLVERKIAGRALLVPKLIDSQ